MFVCFRKSDECDTINYGLKFSFLALKVAKCLAPQQKQMNHQKEPAQPLALISFPSDSWWLVKEIVIKLTKA